MPNDPDATSSAVTNSSFRDPDGRVFLVDERVLRIVRHRADAGTLEFIRSELFGQLIQEELFIQTRFLGDKGSLSYSGLNSLPENDPLDLVFEHERVFFPSYPYEWPAEMLHAAGTLTLDLAERLLPKGFGLKDASPYNVLFRGPKPVFIDLLSFERREPRDPTWRPYAQFVRTFVRPLLVNTQLGLGAREILSVHRDGLNASDVNRLFSPGQKLRPASLKHITLPSLLGRLGSAKRDSIYQPTRVSSPEKALFILERQLKSLRKTLNNVGTRRHKGSVWSNYADGAHHSPEYFASKQSFVQHALTERPPEAVLDIGCNTGEFSTIAAGCGARVVAIDREDELVGTVWSRASMEGLDILPLIVDWTRPTPAIGWRNRESLSFLDRARGRFDCVMMLAVIHHMLVTERIPLDEIFALAAETTTDRLLIEFVPATDPKFKMVTRGNDDLYTFLTREHFESIASKYFRIERSQKLADSERWIYILRRTPVA